MNTQTDFYVNNKEFSAAVIEYGYKRAEAQAANQELPRASHYIGDSILRICEGVSMRPNFRFYSYRDEMVSDALENCMKALGNYDSEAATRSGNPNAHSYFSTIAFYAMVRRIQAEEKQVNIKIEMINRSALDTFMVPGDDVGAEATSSLISELRSSTSSYEKKKEDSKQAHHGWSTPANNRKKKKATPLFDDEDDEIDHSE